MSDRSASGTQTIPPQMPHGRYDVAVLGGGLAGLCMGLQLRRERPDTRVLVAEKRLEPPPLSAFKVGESTVEVGCSYYRDTVGMRDHMEEHHLRKLGLRFFLPAGDNRDITKRVEFHIAAHERAYTHQLDRGLFERELFDRCLAAGAETVRGFSVSDVELGDPHRITLTHDGGEVELSARWVVDASGRANLLRRKLGLGTDTGHHINAAWFRLANGLDLEAWGDHVPQWIERVANREHRRQSTNHLMGEGYWVWLIQLATGPVSIGINADPRFHPFERISTLDAFIDWMHEYEPQLGTEVEHRRADVMDFLRVEDFSYGSSRCFSATERWTLSGEAFAFLDPLYSPGSDFIGYTNTFGGELIERELDGEDVTELAEFYNVFLLRIFETVALYRDNYHLFGNPQIYVVKGLNDSLNYFTLVGSPFVHGRLRRHEDIERRIALIEQVGPQLTRIQQLFRDWHELDDREWQGVTVASSEWAPHLAAQEEIEVPGTEDELIERAQEKIALMKAFAVWAFHAAAANLPAEQRLDPERPVNPNAIGLRPERWEEDGLFDGDGLTLAQALERLGGIEAIDLSRRGAVLAQADDSQ